MTEPPFSEVYGNPADDELLAPLREQPVPDHDHAFWPQLQQSLDQNRNVVMAPAQLEPKRQRRFSSLVLAGAAALGLVVGGIVALVITSDSDNTVLTDSVDTPDDEERTETTQNRGSDKIDSDTDDATDKNSGTPTDSAPTLNNPAPSDAENENDGDDEPVADPPPSREELRVEVDLLSTRWQTAVNGKDPDGIVAVFTSEFVDRNGGRGVLIDGYSSTFITNVQIKNVELVDDDVMATFSFKSEQDSSADPNGQECSEWTIEYRFDRATNGSLAIDGGRPIEGSPQPCTPPREPTGINCYIDPDKGANILGMRTLFSIFESEDAVVVQLIRAGNAAAVGSTFQEEVFYDMSIDEVIELLATDTALWNKFVPADIIPFSEVEPTLTCK